MPAANEPYTRSGLAIINPYGGIWTDRVFESEHQAKKYLRDYWGEKEDLNRFKLASAYLEVRLDPEPVYVPLTNGEQ